MKCSAMNICFSLVDDVHIYHGFYFRVGESLSQKLYNFCLAALQFSRYRLIYLFGTTHALCIDVLLRSCVL